MLRDGLQFRTYPRGWEAWLFCWSFGLEPIINVSRVASLRWVTAAVRTPEASRDLTIYMQRKSIHYGIVAGFRFDECFGVAATAFVTERPEALVVVLTNINDPR